MVNKYAIRLVNPRVDIQFNSIVSFSNLTIRLARTSMVKMLRTWYSVRSSIHVGVSSSFDDIARSFVQSRRFDNHDSSRVSSII